MDVCEVIDVKSVLFTTTDIYQIKFHPDVYSGCYDVLMMSMSLNDIAFLSICDVDFLCIVNGTSKNEAVNLLQNVDLIEKIW